MEAFAILVALAIACRIAWKWDDIKSSFVIAATKLGMGIAKIFGVPFAVALMFVAIAGGGIAAFAVTFLLALITQITLFWYGGIHLRHRR